MLSNVAQVLQKNSGVISAVASMAGYKLPGWANSSLAQFTKNKAAEEQRVKDEQERKERKEREERERKERAERESASGSNESASSATRPVSDSSVVVAVLLVVVVVLTLQLEHARKANRELKHKGDTH